jgi:hypothetical protein
MKFEFDVCAVIFNKEAINFLSDSRVEVFRAM